MDQKTAATLLAHLPTPFYAFDLAALRRRVEYLKASLPPEVQLCFAVKANPFLAAAAAGLTARLELCSPGEVRVCQALGLGEEQYVVSGVYKSPALMRELISGGSGARTARQEAQISPGVSALSYALLHPHGHDRHVVVRAVELLCLLQR